MLRKAHPDDWKEIKELNRKLFNYEFERFDKSLDLQWVDGEDKYFQKATNNNDYLALVYEENDKVVGYLIAFCRKFASYRKKGIQVEIENMFIDEEYRKKHIGSDMFKEIEMWAKGKGATVLSVTASAQNLSAVSFYKKQGFGEYNLTLEKEIS